MGAGSQNKQSQPGQGGGSLCESVPKEVSVLVGDLASDQGPF